MPTPTYKLINSSVLTSSTSSVTFSSITNSYRDLILVAKARPTSSFEAVIMRFNGDTDPNYLHINFATNGSSVQIDSSTGGTSMFYSQNPLVTTSDFVGEFQIFDYVITDKSKSIISRLTNPTQMTSLHAGRWANTSAINSITISPQSANWASGSKFFLYGIVG